jgi:(p)ppGpp synthase/HD superfamily hydrolase
VELFTRWHTWEQAAPELRELVPAATCDELARAVAFALRFHGEQRRPTGVPYLEHLLEAVEVLVRGAGVTDKDVLCAAVLHDVVEDTPCTVAGVREQFGDRVADMVAWVTKPETAQTESSAEKKAAKEAYLAGLSEAPDDAILVKLADRASNVQTLRNLSPQKQRDYYAQTCAFIVPLAASRGGWWSAWYASWEDVHRDLA